MPSANPLGVSLRPCRALLALVVGCGGQPARPAAPAPPPAAEAPPSVDAGAGAARHCPEEMVAVADQFCIDRYEAGMIEDRSGQWFSPFYPPDYEEMRKAVVGQPWGPAALGKGQLRPPVPPLPDWQRDPNTRARAVSRAGITPQGYLSKHTAKAACERAGKRLCKFREWNTACRGQESLAFPYGPSYREGACNVHVPHHPAVVLWGDAGLWHWDPRLNLVTVDGAPLLRPAGSVESCRSRWGEDAVFDMVGNIDEWVDDGKGLFVGGFYARDTVRGCAARVGEHGPSFFDYSTGVRCCADWRP